MTCPKFGQCSFINTNGSIFTKIQTGGCLTIHSNSYTLLQNVVKKWFINKSSKQFASVSPASIPDSCVFYRVIINQRGLVTEKEGHNMQMSPLDLLMHNGREKRASRKDFLCVCWWVCVSMHTWANGKRLNGWISGREGRNNYLNIINPQVRLTTRQFTNVFAALNLFTCSLHLTNQCLSGISLKDPYCMLRINNTLHK